MDHHQGGVAGRLGLPVRLHPGVAEQHGQPAEHDAAGRPRAAAAVRQTQDRASTELNESYVYCLRKKAGDITREVKKALEKEGYEGEAASVVDRSGEGGRQPASGRPQSFGRSSRDTTASRSRGRFTCRASASRTAPETHERLDYYRHLLSQVDVAEFDLPAIDWNLHGRA